MQTCVCHAYRHTPYMYVGTYTRGPGRPELTTYCSVDTVVCCVYTLSAQRPRSEAPTLQRSSVWCSIILHCSVEGRFSYFIFVFIGEDGSSRSCFNLRRAPVPWTKQRAVRWRFGVYFWACCAVLRNTCTWDIRSALTSGLNFTLRARTRNSNSETNRRLRDLSRE